MRRATCALIALAGTVLLTTSACVRTGGEPRGNVGRYCARLDQIDSDREPDAGELDELIRVAPGEIKDAVREVVESGGTPFDDTPEARALLERSRVLCGSTTTVP